MNHSTDYQQRKAFFDSLLTIYGRKPVLEALQDDALPIYKIHLAKSNKPGGIIAEILAIAEQRDIPVQWLDKQALSRISKNARQDQGVAADLQLSDWQNLDQFLADNRSDDLHIVALDGITNPQNLGMIVRSVCAAGIDGLVLPKKGCAALSPLVIKASAGTLFKTRILRCDTLVDALLQLKPRATVCTLSAEASESLFDYRAPGSVVYVLGNETEGVSSAVTALADRALAIPMANGVESLNVAVTAALVAFLGR